MTDGAPPGQQDMAAKRLEGVFLLTDTPEGQVAVPDLTLVLGGAGIEVLKAEGAQVVAVPWSSVTRLSASERTSTPTGGPAVLVEVATRWRTHQFIVSAPDPDELATMVASIASRHGKGRRRRRLFRRRRR